jgi:hypothetical protein
MKISPAVFLAVLMVAMAPSCDAMDLHTYDLDSLIYWSTDIAIATLVDTSSSPSEAPTEAIVISPLHGSLHAGDKLSGLNYQLGFFSPRLSTGKKFILFLDHHPRQAVFGKPHSGMIPYTILPGGLYLIDDHQHVHQYFQESDEGPYVDEANEVSLWTGARSIELPTLDSVEREIIERLKYVDSLRVLLDKKPTVGDIPALLSLLKTRIDNRFFGGPLTDAIPDKIVSNLVAIGDRPSLLEAYQILPDGRIDFYFSGRYSTDKNYRRNSVSYLSSVLSSKTEALPCRISAVEILFDMENVRMRRVRPEAVLATDSFQEIHAEAKKIFVDGAEDARLRIVCLGGLYLKTPDDAKVASEAYLSTESTSLKFAIEEAFLGIGVSAYEALHSPCGPVSSLVSIRSEKDFQQLPHAGAIRFWVKHNEEPNFYDEEFKDVRGPNALDQNEYFILTNRRTKSSFQFKPQWGWGGWKGWNSGSDGENYVDIAEKTDLPPGDYELAYQFSRGGKVVSTGYPLELTVVHTESGNFIKISNPE